MARFTSSEVARLMGCGKRDMTPEELAARPKSGSGSRVTTVEDPMYFDDKALEYIEEKRNELRLLRSIGTEVHSHATTWGHICEAHCFDLLPPAYRLMSDVTVKHSRINCLSGSPDGAKYEGEKAKAVFDIKSPFTLGSFCKLVNPLYDGLTGLAAMLAIRDGYTDKAGLKHKPHKQGEDYYWQLVSNAAILGVDRAELIVYCPYTEELEEIRERVRNMDDDQTPFAWINFASDDQMPSLNKEGIYKNLNVISFDIPKQDIIRLETKVTLAEKYLAL